MLVVVHDGDVEFLFEAAFYLEALGGLDVLEVDASEGGGDVFDGLYELVDVGGVELDVEDVDVGEYFKEESFAFHDGFAGEGADVAEAEDGGAVGDDGDEVGFGRVAVGVHGVALDGEAGLGHAGGVGKGEVVLGGVGFGGGYLDFAGAALFVVEEGLLFQCFVHWCLFYLVARK